VGLFDFFSRRRQRESAVQPPAEGTPLGSFATGEEQPVVGGQISGDAGFDEFAQLQGATTGAEALTALSQLGPMIQKAIESKNVQIHVGEPQTIDLRGAVGLGDEIREIMARHGIDATNGSATGNVDASALGEMQQEILAALAKQHGIETEPDDPAGR
jgi:hypothetical protein